MSSLLILLMVMTGFTDPGIPDGEKARYIGYDAGNQTSREITHVIYDKDDYYYSIHSHHDTTRIIVKCKVAKNDFSTIQVIKDRSGSFQLAVQSQPSGILIKNGLKGKENVIKYPVPFYDRHSLLEVFRAYPFSAPQTIEFPFFEVNVGSVITGTAIYGGTKVITTNLGEIECHKVTLGFKSKLIDTIYKMVVAGRSFDFYYSVAEPHILVYWTDGKGSYIKLKSIESEGK